MKRIATMLLMLAVPGAAFAANNNCATVAGHLFCADPPPATPLAPGQLQALIDQKISQELTILGPLAGVINSSRCSQVIAAAQAAGRYDLVPNVRKRCGL